jgi:isocitrate lyase
VNLQCHCVPVLTRQNQDVSFTYGCLDPVMVTQMAKYLDTVYVSGWQCSSTASSTDEPGPDLADYPMVSFIGDLPLKLTQTGHCPKKGSAFVVCPALPRPQAA